MGCILAAPEVIFFMGGRGYMGAVYAIPPVMAGYGCKFAYTFYVNMERFEKKTKYISIGTLLAAAVNVALNMAFIPRYGFVAAAYTTLAGFVLLAVLHYLMSRKLGLTDMYDNRFIFIMVSLMTLAGCFSGWIYTIDAVWRYCFGFLLLMVCIAMGRPLLKKIR
jgi:O-antigen/teichoic acid export membrane protein